MPTPTPWVSVAEPPREEPTLRSVVMVLGDLVGRRARVVANDVARDLTQSSRALTMEGLPDRATTNLLRFWFVIAVGVVGFLLASTLANGVSMATSFAAPSTPTRPGAVHTPTRHEMTGGTRVLIVTPLVSAPSRVAQPQPTPVAVAPAVVAAAPAPLVRAVPVVARAPVAKAPPPPPVVAKAPPPPPANKALFADALK